MLTLKYTSQLATNLSGADHFISNHEIFSETLPDTISHQSYQEWSMSFNCSYQIMSWFSETLPDTQFPINHNITFGCADKEVTISHSTFWMNFLHQQSRLFYYILYIQNTEIAGLWLRLVWHSRDSRHLPGRALKTLKQFIIAGKWCIWRGELGKLPLCFTWVIYFQFCIFTR